jgi:hypothetical protein
MIATEITAQEQPEDDNVAVEFVVLPRSAARAPILSFSRCFAICSTSRHEFFDLTLADVIEALTPVSCDSLIGCVKFA